MILKFLGKHPVVVAARPSGQETKDRIEMISSVIISSVTEGNVIPPVIKVENLQLNILGLGSYGYMVLCTDKELDIEESECRGQLGTFIGNLLTILSKQNSQSAESVSTANLALVASNTADLVCISDSEGFITFVNEAYLAKTGYNIDEVLGKRPSELMHGPETDEETKKRLLNAILCKRSVQEEILNYTKFGEKFWLQLSIDPVFDNKGSCIAYVAVSRDITERKTTSFKLHQKERMLRSVAASSNEFLVNADVLEATKKCLPILGEAVNVDRVYFFRNTVSEGSNLLTSQIAEWTSPAVNPQINNPEMQNLPIEIIDIFLEDLYQHKPIAAIVSQMPEDLPYRKLLETQDIKSLLIIPIFTGDFFWGLIGFDECKYERIWAEDEISILQYFCITIGNAVERARVTDELLNMYLFPKESPIPLVRIDLEGNIIISNKPAEKISTFRYSDCEYSFPEFFRKIADDLNDNETQKKYEVACGDNIFQITSVLSSNNIHINNYFNDITDLKKSQNDLERLSQVALNYRQGVHFTDINTRITYANESLLRLTGYSREELVGKTPMEVFHGPLTQTERHQELQKCAQTMVPSEVDMIVYRKDGTWFWANIKKQPLKRRSDASPEFFSIIEDISEKKGAEEKLIKSETRISELIKNLKEGILLEDEHRKIALTNTSFTRMFGIPVSPEELRGADCSRSAEETAPLFREPDKFINRISEILTERKQTHAEELELANGMVYERDFVPIHVENEFIGLLWKYSDITERKKRERSLTQKEEKYRNIIANMKMSLVETDTEDIVTYVNQEFLEMTGYSMEEIIGRRSVDMLVADDYRDTVRNKLIIRKEGISDIYTMQVRLRNGELRWWLTSGGPNFNDNGELIGTIGISVDITEQKRLEEELKISRQKAEESSHAKEAFLASMSHEIRTPLNVISGMIRELAREKLTDKQQIYLKNAELASHHLLSIVNDVLDITKIASGQLNLDLGPFSLSQLIEEVVLMLTPESREKMLNMNFNISQILAPVYVGDANRIKQILINIINNSIKYTEKGGISVDCTLLSKMRNIHHLKIRVSDTGIGMDEAFLNHIFDKFSQGDYSSARKAGGTGLGMAITYELVKMMKGTIAVSSRKDYGTSTEITLDLEVGSIEEIRTSSASEQFDDLRDKRILLVEDSDLNRLVALNSLGYYGIKVTEATNGYEAVEKLREATFDAVLMDLQMPIMGGIEATRIIREDMKLTVPVIALTAHAFKAEIDRCMEVGMNDYIIKPFEENMLMAVLVKSIKEGTEPLAKNPEPGTHQINASRKYDLSAIEKMSRGNKEFIQRIIQVFIDQTPAAVEEIKSAWEHGDLETVRRVSHKIKPNLDNFGITDLKDEIRQIESLAEAGTFSGELEMKILKLDMVIREVAGELARELEN
jgi:PAS domain S-box-containing protein